MSVNRWKKMMKRQTAALLLAVLAVSHTGVLTVFARGADVSEKLYINMDYEGGIDRANVVKEIQFTTGDSYTDYGSYNEIVNMTDHQEPEKKEDAVTWARPENGSKLYFQGSLDPEKVEIPWNFHVSYKVNGIETAPERVGGASGTVEINVDAIPNKNVSKYMQDNIILLVLIPMDTADVYSIDAPDSMEASFGNYSGIGFEALPGKEGHFTARVGTDCFESMGVMMIMTPVTVGDLSKIKDLKELKDKFRDNSNSMMDSVEAIMDNVVSMSSQLDKTNEILDELASGKRKLDETRPVIFNGVDVTLQDLRDFNALLEPVNTSVQTSQWMVYDLNTRLNDTNAALQQTSGVMGTLGKRLRTLSREMSSVNTFNIDSVQEDLIVTRTALDKLAGSLVRGGVAAENLKTISRSEDFQRDSAELLYSAALGDAEFEEEYLPAAVIDIINESVTDPASMTQKQLEALIPQVALMLDLYDLLSEPVKESSYSGRASHVGTPSDYYEILGSTDGIGSSYTVTRADLYSMIGAFQQAMAGDPNAVATAVGRFFATKNVVPADQAAIVQGISALASSGGAASPQSTAQASRFIGRMQSMLGLEESITQLTNNTAYGTAGSSLKDSLNELSDAGTEALANAITAYSTADYDDVLEQVDRVIRDIDDVMDAGASVSYQTSRLLDSLRRASSSVDNLTATLNSYYEDVQTALANVSSLIVETEQLGDHFTETAQVLNNTLRAASENFSRAGDEGIELGREAVDNTGNMIENTRKLKEAGADLRQSINDELDEQEADNNFLNMDPDAEKESLTSSKNQAPTSIQIICRSEEITAKEEEKTDVLADAEIAPEKTTFAGRVANIFKTLWTKVLKLFGRN